MSLWSVFRRYPVLRTVIVNLVSGTSFKALVWAYQGPFMVLREVEMLADRDNTARKTVDGEVAVKLADIDFLQVL